MGERTAWDGRWVAAGVVGLALLARALEAIQQPRLFNDGPRFLAMAEAFARGEWRVACADDFHPLTSLLIAGLGSVLPVSLEAAAQVVSVLAGGGAALALWSLCRDAFGPRVALAGAMVFALQPRMVASSSGVQSDGLHLALFLLGVWAAWRALEQRAPRLAALSGLACGLAYLTRPEGLAVAAVLGPWLLLDAVRGRVAWRPALALGTPFALALLALAGPYVVFLHDLTGEWTLTRKKELPELPELSDWGAWQLLDPARDGPPRVQAALGSLDRSDPAPHLVERVAWIPDATGPLRPDGRRASLVAPLLTALGEVLYDGLRALQTPALLLLLCGIVRAPPGRPTLFLLAFVALFFGVLLGLHLQSGYVSRRHWLPAVALLSPFVGRGALRLLDGLGSLAFVRALPWLRPGVVSVAVVALLGHAAVPQIDAHKVARRNAALWLEQQPGDAEPVASHRARDAHFAGSSVHVQLHPSPAGTPGMLARARAEGARFALLDGEYWTPEAAALDWIHELQQVEYRGHRVVVLAIDPPPP